MSWPVLQCLIDDHFLLKFGVISNPQAVYRALIASDEIRMVREALSREQISQLTIRRFVSRLLESFQPGRLFAFDLTLAALAVVMANRPTDFAEEFLSDLARLELSEMPMAIRVARYGLSAHSKLARNQSAVCCFSTPTNVSDRWEVTGRLGAA